MSKSINAEVVEVIFGKIQLKSTMEVFDSSFKFVSTQGGDCSCLSVKICYCRHVFLPFEKIVLEVGFIFSVSLFFQDQF